MGVTQRFMEAGGLNQSIAADSDVMNDTQVAGLAFIGGVVNKRQGGIVNVSNKSF